MLATTLPDLNALDREALQALLVAEHEERIATQERLRSRESEIEHLKLLIAKLRRMQFGRRSEKVQRQIEQLELRLEDLETKQAERARQVEIQPSSPWCNGPDFRGRGKASGSGICGLVRGQEWLGSCSGAEGVVFGA